MFRYIPILLILALGACAQLRHPAAVSPAEFPVWAGSGSGDGAASE